MNSDKINSLKQNNILIISANNEIYDIVNYYELKYDMIIDMFDPVEPDIINFLINKINNDKLNVIFYSNHYQYGEIIPKLNKNINVKWLYSNTISHFSEPYNYYWFKNIIDFYDRKNIDEIILTDKNLLNILKNKYNVKLLEIKINDIDKQHTINNNSIGIIGFNYNPYSNFYNQLSALTLTKYNTVNILSCDGLTKEFCERFNIEYKIMPSIDDIIKNSEINLYCNFDNIKPYYFYNSMNLGIPCILGNTNILDNTKLKDLLVLKSDDDISEISDKINDIEKNYKYLFEEYAKYVKKNKK